MEHIKKYLDTSWQAIEDKQRQDLAIRVKDWIADYKARKLTDEQLALAAFDLLSDYLRSL